MEQTLFEAKSEEGLVKVGAVMSPAVGTYGGRRITYNAYLQIDEQAVEVVVLGYQYDEDGHTLTKPIAIFVDQELFGHLKVDQEGFRVGPDGEDLPPNLVDQ